MRTADVQRARRERGQAGGDGGEGEDEGSGGDGGDPAAPPTLPPIESVARKKLFECRLALERRWISGDPIKKEFPLPSFSTVSPSAIGFSQRPDYAFSPGWRALSTAHTTRSAVQLWDIPTSLGESKLILRGDQDCQFVSYLFFQTSWICGGGDSGGETVVRKWSGVYKGLQLFIL
ncbi:hypothetical protein DFJ73DRAFT_760489 [Zopfochytrium polystomum]|nr:hypothetical protein DFJ73DRAFT_760489 [Zopfochytrium polystomum]